MASQAPLIDLTSEQRTLLEGLARSRETAHSSVLRAAEGEHNKQIAQALGLNEDSVGNAYCRWVHAHDTLAALAGQPRRLRAAIEETLSGPPAFGNSATSPPSNCQIIALARETPPPPLTRNDLVRETIARGICRYVSGQYHRSFFKSGRPQAASHPGNGLIRRSTTRPPSARRCARSANSIIRRRSCMNRVCLVISTDEKTGDAGPGAYSPIPAHAPRPSRGGRIRV